MKKGRFAKVELANGKGVALVSDVDYSAVSQHNWRRKPPYYRTDGTPVYYAQTNIVSDGAKQTVTLHRFILLGVEKGWQVAHLSGDGLDCRRENLVICKHYEFNGWQQGDSRKGRGVGGYFGVRKKENGRYEARVWMGGKSCSAGTFDVLDDALLARDNLALSIHGDYTALNFPKRPNTLLEKGGPDANRTE